MNAYVVIVERVEEGFLARAPDLECATTGHTSHDCELLIREAMRVQIERQIERGETPETPSPVETLLVRPDELGLVAEDESQKYVVVVEEADGNYSAYSPDLLGCVAMEETRAACKTTMKEAMAFHIEGMQADGDDIPPAGRPVKVVLVGLSELGLDSPGRTLN